MADEGFQEKTERATPRRKAKAKEKGQVARSKDLTSMASMGGIVMIFYFGGEYFFTALSNMAGGIMSMQYGSDPLHISRVAIIQSAQIIAPIFLTSIILTLVTTVAQGGFVFKSIEFKIDKINPINGIKRIFSLNGFTELLKSTLKFGVGAWLVYYIMKKDFNTFPMLSAMEINELIRVSGKLIMDAITLAFFYYFIVAIIAYFLERWQHEKSLRMTKQEVREENKETEGDPLIKSRIRTAQREAARKRMMQEVPKATVVITNPQHLAVAIRYDDKDMFAPKIVAKGAGIVAAKIREIATKHGVPIVEDKPIARALFKLELNSFVPEELYVAVAKIIAYIYKLKGKI